MSTENNEFRDPLEPYAESNAAQNIPYRGSINHGVEFKTFNPVTEPWSDVTDGELIDDPEPEIPVPVRIVTADSGVEHKLVRAHKTYVTDTISRILAPNRARTSAKIKNVGQNTVYVGGNGSANVNDGYSVPPGGELSVTATGEVNGIVKPSVTGGWINIFPRQTLNTSIANQIFFGPEFDAATWTNCRLFTRIWSISGTTPSITSRIQTVVPWEPVPALASYAVVSASLNVSQHAITAADLAGIPRVRGAILTVAADQVTDVEQWIYVPQTGSTDPITPIEILTEYTVTE